MTSSWAVPSQGREMKRNAKYIFSFPKAFRHSRVNTFRFEQIGPYLSHTIYPKNKKKYIWNKTILIVKFGDKSTMVPTVACSRPGKVIHWKQCWLRFVQWQIDCIYNINPVVLLKQNSQKTMPGVLNLLSNLSILFRFNSFAPRKSYDHQGHIPEIYG